ncbi:MAG: hypothetical protein MJ174_07560 [Treponema sp.]|nr:hypothetical protein [Treponema sp.]
MSASYSLIKTKDFFQILADKGLERKETILCRNKKGILYENPISSDGSGYVYENENDSFVFTDKRQNKKDTDSDKKICVVVFLDSNIDRVNIWDEKDIDEAYNFYLKEFSKKEIRHYSEGLFKPHYFYPDGYVQGVDPMYIPEFVEVMKTDPQMAKPAN